MRPLSQQTRAEVQAECTNNSHLRVASKATCQPPLSLSVSRKGVRHQSTVSITAVAPPGLSAGPSDGVTTKSRRRQV